MSPPCRSIWLVLAGALWCAGTAVGQTGAGDAGPRVMGPEFGPLLQPQAVVQAHAYVDVERVLLGQTFNLLIVVDADSGDQIRAELPSNLSLGPDFEHGRRRQEQRTRVDGSPSLEIQIEVTAWRVGWQTIPAIRVVVPERGELRTVTTEPVRVQVVGLVVDDQTTIRDGTQPVAVIRRDTRPLYLLAVGLALLLALVAGVLVWRALARPAQPTVVRPIQPRSPDAIALQALRALADSGALEADDRAPAFHAMDEIMRAYFARRFAISGHDATTAELGAELERAAGRPDASDGLAELVAATIRPWLENCDLVKFAGARASTEDAVHAYKDAIDVVEKTAPTAARPAAEIEPSGPEADDA